MGGDWIPDSFVSGEPSLWPIVTKFIDAEEWYRMVSITRKNAATLSVRDGNERREVAATDELLELFLTLKKAGPDSAIVADRLMKLCWITKADLSESFLDHSIIGCVTKSAGIG